MSLEKTFYKWKKHHKKKLLKFSYHFTTKWINWKQLVYSDNSMFHLNTKTYAFQMKTFFLVSFDNKVR